MRALVLLTAAAFFVAQAYGAEIRDLAIGDKLYVQGMLSDEPVYVLDVDSQRHLVKVRSAEDGNTIWVKPESLIYRDASQANDAGRTAIVAVLIACLVAPDACKEGHNPSQSTAQQTPVTSVPSKFRVINQCSHDVRVAIAYDKAVGSWATVGWWTIGADSSQYLQFADGSYAATQNNAFYYYAETPDGSMRWGAPNNVTVGGRTVGMALANARKGLDSELVLTCPEQ